MEFRFFGCRSHHGEIDALRLLALCIRKTQTALRESLRKPEQPEQATQRNVINQSCPKRVLGTVELWVSSVSGCFFIPGMVACFVWGALEVLLGLLDFLMILFFASSIPGMLAGIVLPDFLSIVFHPSHGLFFLESHF